MEILTQDVRLHPQYLDALFACKRQVSGIFRDIIGLYDIHHMALSRIDAQGRLLSFSATPAIEFNLFNSPLWRFDGSYQPAWFRELGQSRWEDIYAPERYDELYYLKQTKHALQTTQSLAAKLAENHFVFSFASRDALPATQALFASRTEELYKIGQYVLNLLLPFFERLDATAEPTTSGHKTYEISN
ncbi:MAG: hypothetical protein JJT82_03950 [Legionellaceae bacterium]|nr:hypothetical protein [Legionellaceae bacterium]